MFTKRESYGIFYPHTNKIVKEVIIIPANNSSPRDLFDLIQKLEEIGSDSILIDRNRQFNELPKKLDKKNINLNDILFPIR